jgi:hypothetical protein
VPWPELGRGFAITLLVCLAAAAPVAIAAGCQKPLGLIE